MSVISREAVYAKLWEMPIKEVVAFYDTDYHQLRTFCIKNKIPTPPLGYWNKVAASKPLPKRPPLEPMGYYRHALRTGFKRQSERDAVRDERTKKYERQFVKTRVPQVLNRPHELVRSFNRGEYQSRQYNSENAKLYQPPFSAGTNRALRILDTLLKGLEANGYQIHEDLNWWIDAVSGPHRISFRVRERYRQIKTKAEKPRSFPTEAHRILAKYSRDSIISLEPTGIVEITITGWSTWVDKEGSPLEDQLPSVLASVLANRDAAIESASLQVERDAEKARIAVIMEAERKERERDQAAWNAFKSMGDAWESRSKLQQFYFALRALPADGTTMVGDRSIDEWKIWLEQKIAEQDPLGSGAEEVFRRLDVARRSG